MRNAVLLAILLLFGLALWAVGSDLPAPSTTLSAETGDNTSAAPGFLAQTNGNLGAGNISKLPIRSLLYPGATTKIYAHVEPWWGSSHHIDIGYSSQDPAQVHRQVMDMISRGLDGAVADWYGPDSYEALGVKLLFTEAETQSNFGMFVEVEHGAVLWDSCYPTCNATTAVIQLFTRMAGDFFSSPAYVRIAGRPVVREFGMETIPFPSGQTDPTWNVVDWNAVQAQVPGNPLIIHRNVGGFSIAQSGGAFGWMEPKTLALEPPNYDGTDELVWFYSHAVSQYATMPAFGAVWKGFNDTLADWAPPGGRHIEQNCGQTWLRTFATANQYYSQTNQLPVLQLVTWNDYEEGTELETGIDNCFNISATVSGTSLQWSIAGDESTVDHYTVFISADGTNLASLGDLPPGMASFDLSAFTIPAGSYSLFVKAIGKPSLRNQMTAPVALTIAAAAATGGTTATAKTVTISATPSSAQIKRGQAAQFTLTLTETGASDPVSLSCTNVPAGATCGFSPATVTPSSGPASVALTISTLPTMAAQRRSAPLLACWLPAVLAMCVVPGVGNSLLRKRRRALGLLALLVMLAGLQLACGGSQTTVAGALPPATPAAKSYTVTVTATSGAIASSTDVNLTVQ